MEMMSSMGTEFGVEAREKSASSRERPAGLAVKPLKCPATLETYLLIAIIILAAFLRFYRLGHSSLHSDEIQMVKRALGTADLDLGAGNAFLYFPILQLFIKLLGQNEFTARLPAALAGIAAIPLLYKTGKMLLGPTVGLTSAFLLSISTIHIHYSQEAHSYALFTFLSLLSFYYLWQAIQGDRTRHWLAFGLSIGLSILIHLFSFFVLFSELTILLGVLLYRTGPRPDGTSPSGLMNKRTALHFLAAMGIILLLSAPPLGHYVAPPLMQLGVKMLGLPPIPGARQFASPPKFDVSLELFKNVFINLTTWSAYDNNILIYVFWGSFLVGLLYLILKEREKALTCLVWMLAPLLPTAMFTQMTGQQYHTRRIIFILPIYLIVIATGLTSLSRLLNRLTDQLFKARVPIWSLSLILTVGLFWPVIISPLQAHYSRKEDSFVEHWKQVALFLEQVAQPDDIIVIWPDRSLRYYYPHPEQLLYTRSWSPDGFEVESPDNKRLWFVLLVFFDYFEPESAETIKNWISHNDFVTFQFDRRIFISYNSKDTTSPEARRDEQAYMLQEALRVYPKGQYLHQTLGDVYAQQGKTEAALSEYTAAASLTPDTPSRAIVYVRLAGALEQDRPDEALNFYEQAIEIDPTYAPAYFRRGILLQKRGNEAGAMASFRQALTLGPEYVVERAATMLSKLLVGRGEVEGGIEVLQAAQDRVSDSGKFRLHLQLAQVYQANSQPDRAIAQLEQAFALALDDTALRKLLSNTYRSLGQIDQAIVAYQPLLATDPDNVALKAILVELYLNQAEALFGAGELDQAISASRQLLEIAPDKVAGHIAMADIYRTQGKVLVWIGQEAEATVVYAEAIAAYERAIDLDPNQSPELYITLGRMLSDQGEQERAIAILEQATSLNSLKTEAWANLGLAYSRQGRQEEAISAYRQVLKLNPDHYWAIHLLAQILYDREQWAEVISLEQRAVEVAPDDQRRAVSLALMARAYYRSGDTIEACNLFRQAYAIQQNQGILDEIETLGCSDKP